ncbi:MAG: DUF615 domain-containing protein [Saccharospirillaceae bacterium]|nr:DUF615 domain-containing protein [Saccharospirillaceae bacterium]
MARKKDSFEDEIEYEIVSKTEMKREMDRLQELGKRLTELNANQWQTLTIKEVLRDALVESKRLKHNEARRRHLQYIGKLMRDEDVELVQQQVDLLDPSSEAFGRRVGQMERWRERLIKDDKAMNTFIDEYPHVDRQHLRNLVRNATKEMSSEPPKPGSGYKKLFQFIKETMV